MAANDWNVSEPIDHTKIRDVPQKIRDVTSSAKHLIAKEHVQPSTSGAGGQHLKGSVRVYLDSVAPTTDPEGNNLATADTSDNGRISVLTGSSNTLKVYVATSAGISTGWEHICSRRVYADTAINAGGYKVEGVGTGTVSGQAIHVGQIDTTYFSLYQPATTASLQPKLFAGTESYLAASGQDGVVVASIRDAAVTWAKLSSGSAIAGMSIGTYTGNGAASRALTGVGFQPAFLIIITLLNGEIGPVYKTTDMGLYTAFSNGPYLANIIDSLDSDGFTTGSSTQFCNYSGRDYAYIAFRAS